MGAIAEGGIEVRDEGLIRSLGIPPALVSQVAMRERLELDRRDQGYRGGRRQPHIADRTVIVVDDGLATGSTMEAAVLALRQLKPARIVVAVPVGAPETCQRLTRLADEVVAVERPAAFGAVGAWYVDFRPTGDDEVRQLLGLVPGTSRSTSDTASSRPDPIAILRRHARPLSGSRDDFDELIEVLGSAKVVLLGEASHGTHEFYRDRALITKRLITEKHFNAIAVEADWPDAYRVNRFVRRSGQDRDATEALADFRRFPAWMWRNADILDFVGWLAAHNERVPDRPVGFYGLDLYSLHTSMRAVIAFLDKVDPAAASVPARRACFDDLARCSSMPTPVSIPAHRASEMSSPSC
jgi:hypothetical protein